MQISFSLRHRILLTFTCFAIAVAGFMIKLPSSFRHMDKELHAAFYFTAAAFLNILFAKRKAIRHIIIFIFLYLFGMAIEMAQAYSNQFFTKRIHGRYDPEDVEWNLKGLVVFSIIWVIATGIHYINKRDFVKRG